MRPLLLSLLLAGPLPALAGGLGLVTTAGGHSDMVYGYTQDEAGDWAQTDKAAQIGANYGGGIEVVLGDRDNKTLGVMRVILVQDAPQQALDGYTPVETLTDDSTKSSPVRATPLNSGLLTGGLQWGILGDPTTVQLTVVGNLGAGLFTEDLTMFLTGDAGVGGTWMPERRLQVNASLTGGARVGGIRYRGHIRPVGNAYVGVRYLFD